MSDEGYAILLLCIVVGFIAFSSGVITERRYWHQSAIKRDYAMYCADTGEFAWKNECGDVK